MKMTMMMMACFLLLAAFCSAEWRASVVENLDALVSSCVVVPCSFSHPGGNLPSSRLRGLWHHKDGRDQYIYHEDKSRMRDAFKGRTRMLGDLGRDNCTLEITNIQNHDNGPFCFRVELVRKEDNEPTKDMFSFVEDCVNLKMLLQPPRPTLTHPKAAYQQQPYTITCTVAHTCPTHAPTLKWSRGGTDVIESHKDIRYGNWEVQSTLTIIPEERDDHTEITCTADFNGRIASSRSMALYVKRAVNYNHIIIPTVVALGSAVLFGLVCVLMARKYRNRIAELQSQEGSMWNRLSRLSRRGRSGGRSEDRSDGNKGTY